RPSSEDDLGRSPHAYSQSARRWFLPVKPEDAQGRHHAERTVTPPHSDPLPDREGIATPDKPPTWYDLMVDALREAC
ncbi:MAG TPA: hypothetical protein PK867_20185, partial [Pirellulales bacterium]|nr:hypothetical protein [Pirellulales bacterium]